MMPILSSKNHNHVNLVSMQSSFLADGGGRLLLLFSLPLQFSFIFTVFCKFAKLFDDGCRHTQPVRQEYCDRRIL